jgi:hypothetical protein
MPFNFRFKGIDALIDYLKGPTPYDKISASNLWNIFKNLSDGLLDSNTNLQSLNILPSQQFTGLINGTNKNYILEDKPVNESIMIFKAGLLLKQNIDFTLKDNLVVFTTAPAMASVLQFFYYIKN